jgi:hypothetical protein
MRILASLILVAGVAVISALWRKMMKMMRRNRGTARLLGLVMR